MGQRRYFLALPVVQLSIVEEEWRTKKNLPTLEHLSLFFDSFVKHHLSNWSFLMLKQCEDQSLNLSYNRSRWGKVASSCQLCGLHDQA
jgi:hypothetical protein